MHTPLEQFQIIPIFPIKLLHVDLSFSNLFLMNAITLLFFIKIVHFFSSKKNYLNKISFFLIPNSWQVFIESEYSKMIGEAFVSFWQEYKYLSKGNLIGWISHFSMCCAALFVAFKRLSYD